MSATDGPESVPPGDAGMAMCDPEAFVAANTELLAPPLVPEVDLHLASETLPIWQLTEEDLSASGLPSPFWAFAWAGGQALARYVFDHPETVRGKSVLDFAAGSGVAAIAAMKAGAVRALAADIDPVSCAAVRLNAAANEVTVETTGRDLVGTNGESWDVVLAGDICYEQPLAGRVEAWLRALAGRGALVLIGDPGRTYLPKAGLERQVAYAVKTTRALEDTDVRNTAVWKVVQSGQ